MSQFTVQHAQLTDAASRLDHISSTIEEFQGKTSGHRHDAQGTAAAQSMSDMADHWSAVLPHFASAGSGLTQALRAAASAYETTDQNIAQAAATAPVTS